MNIFVLDRAPMRAAQYHCDKHVVKMILETAQILSTVHALHGYPHPHGYKPTHKNHPCTLWAAENNANYVWLLTLGFELCREFEFRRGKEHKTAGVITWLIDKPVGMVTDEEMTPFAQAMPEKYRRESAVDAYRAYYAGEKSGIAGWDWGREPPTWWQKEAVHINNDKGADHV